MMNFRDRSPNTMGSGGFDGDGDGNRGGVRGRGGRGGRFRGGGGFRGNNFRRGDGRTLNDRPSPWKDDDRFDNKNSGGFRGGSHYGSGSVGGATGSSSFNDNRDMNRDNRDFGSNRDVNRTFNSAMNQRGSNSDSGKWSEPQASVKPAPMVPPVTVPASPTAARPQRTNDLEIIVTHKSLTQYAEFIERRLKANGFNVDILYPNEEVPLGRVLANIASRGTLYALVVTQLSEEHRSVTINVLYGQTQEHRNMPLDDALTFLNKNFEAFMKGERAPVVPPLGAVPVTPGGIPLGEKHPELIQSMLSTLIENRPLNVTQYDRLIGYLQEKRDRLYKTDSAPQKTKLDLQNRILGILASSENKLLDSKSPGLTGLLPPTQQPNPSILNDSQTLQAVKDIVQSKIRYASFGPRM